MCFDLIYRTVVSFWQPHLPKEIELEKNSVSVVKYLYGHNNPALDYSSQMKRSWPGQPEVEDKGNPGIDDPPQKKRSSCSGQSKVEDKDKTCCWNSKRLFLDLKELWQDAPKGVHANPSEESIFIWNIRFPAPNGKKVEATLHFGPNYPFSPPTMFIKKRLFHPNISSEGEVCLQDLQKLWTPAYSIWSLIVSVQVLLDDPNPDNAVNSAAGKMLMKYPQAYYNRAWQCFEMLDSSTDFDLDEIKEDEWEFLFET